MMRLIVFGGVAACCSAAWAGSGFASGVAGYDPGSGAAAGFTDPTSAIGSATRFTSPASPFGSAVTPFSPPFGADEIVSIGTGGFLTLRFDDPITNAASHAFGIDLILFGNGGFVLTGDGTTGGAPGLFGAGGEATVEISADGANWFLVDVVDPEARPTLAYSDLTEPFPDTPGQVATDFFQPLDPGLELADFANLDIVGLSGLYAGSGGGVGIDIAGSGLDEAWFVRLSNHSDMRFEIDAVAAVPAAPGVAALALAGVGAARRRRR